MAFPRAAILAAVLALSAGLAAADTTGKRFEGYTYASDVTGYLNMTMDFCDIQAAISAGNFSEVLEIYSMGKNSFSGATKRTFYRFASHVPTSNEPLYNLLTMGRNGSWLDDMIKAAIAAEDGHLTVGLITVAYLKYFVHEVDEAGTKITAYLADPANLTILISDDRGAPHNVDEAWALWAGGMAPNCGTAATAAAMIGKDMETTFIGTTYVNAHMTAAVNEFLGAARAGDLMSFNATRNNMVRAMTIMGMQGVLRAAYMAEMATKCGRSDEVEMAKTEIKVHWTYLYPLLAGRPTSASYAARWAKNVRELGAALTATNVDFGDVYREAKIVVGGMSRKLSEVGFPSFTALNAEWNCPYSARP